MQSAHELFKNLKEEQGQIESIEAEVRLKTDSVRSLAQKLEELENVAASYDKDLLSARGEYTNVMETHNHYVGLLADEKKKQYSLHLQLNAAESYILSTKERGTASEALLQMASKHATSLHRLAFEKIHSLKGFSPQAATTMQPPKVLKVVEEEGPAASVGKVVEFEVTNLEDIEDLPLTKKMRITEHSEPLKQVGIAGFVASSIPV